MLDLLFFSISKLNNACSPVVINRSGLRLSHYKVFRSVQMYNYTKNNVLETLLLYKVSSTYLYKYTKKIVLELYYCIKYPVHICKIIPRILYLKLYYCIKYPVHIWTNIPRIVLENLLLYEVSSTYLYNYTKNIIVLETLLLYKVSSTYL